MKRGKIVLTPFPFTDLSGQKRRPALIVSRSDRSDRDVIIAFIGSYHGNALEPTELLIEDTDPDFVQTGLKRTSVVKLDKITTVEGSILLGELGELPASLSTQVDARLRYALEI